MIRFRPGNLADLDGVLRLLTDAGDSLKGLSTLRPYPDLIEGRLAKGVESFGAEVAEPGEEVYFFVLEDMDAGTIIGTGAIYAAVGKPEAFYSYRIGTRVFTSRELGVYKQVPTLFLTNDYTGKSEIGSLFLDSAYRRKSSGRLTSISRLLFIAEHPERFTDKIFAEMRGFQLPDGTAPFWEGIGRHFFGMPFPEADDISARGNKTFIAELMPVLPIYVTLLPYAVQDAIGRVHPETEPALRLLQSEGFASGGYIDIFDGGPTLEVEKRRLRAVVESEIAIVVVAEPTAEGTAYIVTNRGLANFRSVVEEATINDNVVTLRPEVADALEISDGDSVRCLPVRP